MVDQNTNKYEVKLEIINSGEIGKLDSLAINEISTNKNPLMRNENVHKISFIDLGAEAAELMREFDNDIDIDIKLNIKNLTYDRIVFDNVLRIIGLSDIIDGPNHTYNFSIYCVGLIAFKMNRENNLSAVTISPDGTQPITKNDYQVHKLMTLFKEKLEERHGDTLTVNLSPEGFSTSYQYEYLRLPDNIKDIHALDYINTHYSGFFFPQYFYLDDMAFQYNPDSKVYNHTVLRQLDLGYLDLATKYNSYDKDHREFINHTRKFMTNVQPYLDNLEMDRELNQSIKVVRNVETDNVKVYQPNEESKSTEVKLFRGEDGIQIGNDENGITNLKNYDITYDFDEFEIHEKAKNIFRNGGGVKGSTDESTKEMIPQLETWEFNDTCPFYLNFDNLYNFGDVEKYTHYPIDLNYKFYKEMENREVFVVSAEASFYVTERTNLIAKLLN